MADIDYGGFGGTDDEWDDWIKRERDLNNSPAPSASPAPSPSPAPSSQDDADRWNERSRNDPSFNPRDALIARDSSKWEAALRTAGGNLYDPSDLEGVRRQVSYAQNAGQDPDKFIQEAIKQYDRRREPTASAGGRGGDLDTDGDGRVDQGWTKIGEAGGGQWSRTPPIAPGITPGSQALSGGGGGFSQPQTNVGPQFSDPITSMIEQFAQRRAQERENPSAGSGQALLEQALREIAGQFQGGGYTPGEQEIFQTQAIDPLEKLRAARKQQVIQNLASRGITLDSGVAKQMLADVDRQFDGQRSTIQAGLAGDAARERTARQMQAIQLLSALSQGENARLNEGFQYRSVPLNLADRSFNQGLQMYNAAGNPLAMAGPLQNLMNSQQGRQDNVQEMLGYLASILAAS